MGWGFVVKGLVFFPVCYTTCMPQPKLGNLE
jgi:hypothetical protein